MQYIRRILFVPLFTFIMVILSSADNCEYLYPKEVGDYSLYTVEGGYAVANYRGEDASELTYLFIPSQLEDKNIIQLGVDTFGAGGTLRISSLERVYFPNGIEKITYGYLEYGREKKVFYVGKVLDVSGLISHGSSAVGNHVYVLNKYYDAFKTFLDDDDKSFLHSANVVYCLDEEEKNYYYIDYYDANSLIVVIPPDPTLEDKEFDGWYKEKECINKWDFETDTIYQTDENFVETILYAKWK